MKRFVVVLTALNVEYNAVRARLTNIRTHLHPRGTRFEIGNVRGGSAEVVLGMTGKGNHPAAVIAERAIHQFKPAAVLFVGVAGALWDTTRLGDIVVATHVYGYHGGTSEDDGFRSRPRVWEVHHGLLQLAAHVARTGEWLERQPDQDEIPQVHFGAIAAGEVVQNSRTSVNAQHLREHYNDATAIEMEAAGVAQAGHLNGAAVGVIRGISDMADGTKATAQDRTWQPRAVDSAAAFATHLAEELVNGLERTGMDENVTASRSTTNNTSFGQVGIQASTVSNSTVWMTTAPPPTTPLIEADLAAICAQLGREHAAGAVDEETYQAARAEVAIAQKAFHDGTAEDRRTIVLALKRLRGLVGDLVDLGAKVAALIAAVQGLS